MIPLLSSLRVLEVGGRGAAVCGRLFAELGADVLSIRAPDGVPDGTSNAADSNEALIFDARKRITELDLLTSDGRERADRLFLDADLLAVDLPFAELAERGLDPERLRRLNPRAVIAAITPFGLTGSHREYTGSDLIAFHSSGIARLLTGRVEDADAEPPVRAAGEQSDFATGVTAACASMHAIYAQQQQGAGQLIDVSAQEALSLMAARELAMPGFGGQPVARVGHIRGGGAVIAVLPTSDGHVAVSPREQHQWDRWLHVLGDPDWGAEPRFATRADRTEHFDDLYELMAQWSRQHTANEIADTCQQAHVPCFPFGSPSDMIGLPQLEHRGFFTPIDRPDAAPLLAPRPPFGFDDGDYAPPLDLGLDAAASTVGWLPREDTPTPSPTRSKAGLPLAGMRVLDLSWVIAGPTSTRYLAAMGAEVIKVEAPDRPDTGRVSELHDVLGQSKLALALDLKADGALDALRSIVERSDVVVENFATGVMERLGLGYEQLREIRPEIILLSASGLGRSGPDAEKVAYGNLLSAYTGFSSLNGFPGREPRTGLAWADPLCGLLIAFSVAAALRGRGLGGGGRHIDFSMLEALLWTMPGALVNRQLGEADDEPAGNEHARHIPHGVYRCAGDDRWLAIAVTNDVQWHALCAVVEPLADLETLGEAERRAVRQEIDERLAAWTAGRDTIDTMDELQAAGVPASTAYSTLDLFGDAHLWERDFYKMVREQDGTERFLPGLPWRSADGAVETPRAAPALGQHSEQVLREVAGLDDAEIAALRTAGAFG